MAEKQEKPGFFAEILGFMGCGNCDTDRSRMESADSRNGQYISPNPMARPLNDSRSIPTGLSTSPTARSRMESADTPNGRGISPNPMARPLNDSHSIPTRLSTSPTARSRGSNLDDALSLAEKEKRVSLTFAKDAASLPSITNFRKESSTTTSRDTSPTAAARPQKSYGDIKLEHLKLERQQSPPAKTLFKAQWKSFGPFGCLADHTMNECINLMKVCYPSALTRNLESHTDCTYMTL